MKSYRVYQVDSLVGHSTTMEQLITAMEFTSSDTDFPVPIDIVEN